MKVELEPGVYVIAVSGGVDSVTLLRLLINKPDISLVVAHFDHGIRADSAMDARLVKSLARKHDIPFETKRVELGAGASEEVARRERYKFLYMVADKYGAQAIITAHHQDDVIETMMLNMLRGSGRKGLSSLRSSGRVLRPLIPYEKADITSYAKKHKLQWHEDETNQDESYARNHIRKIISQRLDEIQRKSWVRIYEKMSVVNNELDQEIADLLQDDDYVKRVWLLQFPHSLACELIALLLRKHNVELSSRHIQSIVIICKTARAGTQHNIDISSTLYVDERGARLVTK